ncbi:MAG: hypothetical protein ACE5GO_03255 [Anaerolineales bacterium]
MKTSKALPLLLLILAILACSTILPEDPTPTPVLTSTPEPPSASPTTKPATPTTTAPTETADIVPDTSTPLSASASTPASLGPCGNVLYPMVLDNQWRYEITSEGETSRLTFNVSAVDENTATLQTLTLETGMTSETTVECEDSTILNLPLSSLGFLFGDVEGDVELTYVSGVFAPSRQTFLDNDWNYTWESEYVASGGFTFVDEGDVITVTLQDSPLYMTWQTAGAGDETFEAIEVQAGTFPQAIKITRETTFDFTITFEEEGITGNVQATLIYNHTLWYEPFVGLLKQQSDQASIRIGAGTFPIEAGAVVELVEFRGGE